MDLSTVLSQYELIVFKHHKLIMCMYGELRVHGVRIYMYMISTCKCIIIRAIACVKLKSLQPEQLKCVYFLSTYMYVQAIETQ